LAALIALPHGAGSAGAFEPESFMNVAKTAVVSTLVFLATAPWAAEPTPAVNLVGRPVPEIDTLPEGPYRTLVEQGHELSTRTFAVIGPEVKNAKKHYAGNNLACTSCHQAGGAKPFAIPWVGVTATFPQYRGRENQISTVEERINGCMERSMNGKPLPLGSPAIKALLWGVVRYGEREEAKASSLPMSRWRADRAQLTIFFGPPGYCR
jgi:thiosulfate dehydrogenase